MTSEENLEKQEVKESQHELNFLLDTSYSLLKLFREMCPGTYKHSQTLSAMVEGVSLDLGLDVVFMKVACMYHDVGKMYNARYFTENILDDEDPHKDLDPWMSYQIISTHVPHSTNILLNNGDFPTNLIKVVSQHHGNGVIEYFYNKLIKYSTDVSTTRNENDFRYYCSRPQSVEAAVLMIVDHVEATSRSLFQAGKLDPLQVIEQTINNLLDDGQLDDVTMKLGDLKKVKKSMAKELEGTFQKRVDYTEVAEGKKDDTKEKEE